MMKRRVLLSLVVCAVLMPALVGAQERRAPLATKLPGDKTAVYVSLDLKRSLGQMGNMLTFLDPATAGKIAYQVKELYSMGRELAAKYEFTPMLFDRLAESDVYFVVVQKAEPEVIARTYQTPKRNEETWEEIPGEFEEHSYSETHNYTMSLVIATPEEKTATDFVQQYKALMDREREKSPDSAELQRVELEVEKGELVGQKEGRMTVGSLENMIIISEGNPKELWAALMAPPEKAVANTPLYQRITGNVEEMPEAVGMVNLGELIRKGEAGMKQAVDDAQKMVNEGTGQAQTFPPPALQLQIAQAAYSTFEMFNKLFSLNKLQWMGGDSYFAAGADHSVGATRFLLSHGEPISPLLNEVLSGSGSFQPPAIGKQDTVAVMVRVDVGRIITEVLNGLTEMGPPVGPPLQQGLQSIKQELGVGLDELLALPASDSYLFVDLVESDVESSHWQYDEEKQDWKEVKEKVHTVLPEVTAFWGLKDPNAARETLAALMTQLGTKPESNALVKKRTYQETDVYCLGRDVTEPDVYPDGKTSFALVVVDRYLTFGSWDDVTKAIRQLGPGQSKTDEALMSVVQANPNANLLIVMPKAFQEKAQKLTEKLQGEQNVFDALMKELDAMHMGLEDQDLESRIKSSLHELVAAYQVLSQKGAALSPNRVVVKGEHKGNFYEISSRTGLTK